MAPPYHASAAAGGKRVPAVSAQGYAAAARAAAALALAEDLAGYGDVFGSAFTGVGVGRVIARGAGVLSGSAAFVAAAEQVDKALSVDFAVTDGERFAATAVVATLSGPMASILALERTGLNFLGRLSGVATMTARYVEAAAGTKTRIAATRKTTPGLRALEKQAVVHGGGTPHRFGLFDGVMIKDNHAAAAGGVTAAIALARASAPHLQGIEVEVDTLAQLDEALAAGVDIILLDNMGIDQVRRAVAQVAGRAVVEASGGVGIERVGELAAAGVDIISVGALTTRADWVDFGLDMEA
jgi:nicotinate-nucleotide pyrophosphorylase (carboxylating)